MYGRHRLRVSFSLPLCFCHTSKMQIISTVYGKRAGRFVWTGRTCLSLERICGVCRCFVCFVLSVSLPLGQSRAQLVWKEILLLRRFPINSRRGTVSSQDPTINLQDTAYIIKERSGYWRYINPAFKARLRYGHSKLITSVPILFCEILRYSISR